MKKKIKPVSIETITQFSEENGISQEAAIKILGVLYKKGEDAKDLNRLLWRMEMFLKKNAIPALMEKMSADQIGKLVDEMIAEYEMMESRHDTACCNEGSAVTVWGFTDMSEMFSDKVFVTGDKVEIQIMRSGKWQHPMYGEVKITPEIITDVKKNFDDNTRGIELAVDENHEGNHKALGWYRELTKKGKDALFATIELTKKGADLMNDGAYKYFSPEISFNKIDEESGKSIKNLLIGGAFTNRPFFKAMTPLLASEEGGQFQAADRHQNNGDFTDSNSNNILYFNTSTSMKKTLELIAQFCDKATINAEEKAQLEAAFAEMKQDEISAELTAAVEEIKAKFSEEAGSDGTGSEGGEAGEAGNEGTDDKGSSASTEEAGQSAADPAKEDDQEGSDSAAGGEKTITANEKGEVVIQASEYESMKALAASAGKLVREARKNALEKAVVGLAFSESNKVGVVMPKQTKEIVDFALSLSEKGAEKFLGIIGKLQTLSAGEVGHSNEASAFNEEHAEQIAFLMEKMAFSEEMAIQAVKDAEKVKSQK